MSNIKKGSKLTVSTANGISRDISNNLGVLEVSGPGMSDVGMVYGTNPAHFVIGSTDVSGILQLGINQDGNTFIDANINNNHKDIIMQKYGGNIVVGSGAGSISKVGIQTNAPNSTVHINSTDGIIIPVGTAGQRPDPAYQGMIRYNTTTSQFEGYGPGGNWGSLGGVVNVAQNTKITVAEPNADSSNNEIKFYTAPTGDISANSATLRMIVNDEGNVGIGTSTPQTTLDISGTITTNKARIGTGDLDDYSFSVQQKLLAGDGAANDYFGGSVAISGNYAIVGARYDDDKGSGSGSAYIFDVTTGTELHKLVPEDGAANDHFGYSVAISGNYAIVGAYKDDDKGTGSGSAYIFNVQTGAQLHKLVPEYGAASDYFGWSVAMSGNYAIVGAKYDDDGSTDSGSAYIFNVQTGVELRKLVAIDAGTSDYFGYSVAIDGNYAIVGANSDDDNGTDSGSAYIFNVQTGTQLHKLVASDGAVNDYFGHSVAISGNYAIVGGHYNDDNGSASGSAYIFNVQTGAQLQKLVPSDGVVNGYFGYSVTMSGNYAIVGTYGDTDNGTNSGSAYIFNVQTGALLHKHVPAYGAAGDSFGYSVAMSGNYAIVGAMMDDAKGTDSGSAYIFGPPQYDLRVLGGIDSTQLYVGQDKRLNDYSFSVQQKLLAGDGGTYDNFGYSAISGNYAIVGAPYDDDKGSGSGSAYIFNVQTGAELHKLVPEDGAANDNFGYSVAISGNYAIVGAPYDDDKGATSGSAYIFDVTTGTELHKLVAIDGAASDYFGYSVAISGNYAIVGAYSDDDNGSASGSAYIYSHVLNQGEIHLDGRMGIGTLTPQYPLHIVGDQYIDGNLDVDGALHVENLQVNRNINNTMDPWYKTLQINLQDYSSEFGGLKDSVYANGYNYFIFERYDNGHLSYIVRIPKDNFSSNHVEFVRPFDTDSNLRGFAGITTDGTYIYACVYANGIGTNYNGHVLRIPTNNFNVSAMDYFDVNTVSGSNGNLKGHFGGCTTDGKHLYLAPYSYGSPYSPYFVRIDLNDFSATGVEWMDVTTANGGHGSSKGFFGIFIYRNYVYLVGGYNGGYHGNIVRVPLNIANGSFSGTFVHTIVLSSISSSYKGYTRGYGIGKYIYLVPNYNGGYHDNAIRISIENFSTSGVEVLNLGQKIGTAGGFTDGYYAYYSSYTGGNNPSSRTIIRVPSDNWTSEGMEKLNLNEIIPNWSDIGLTRGHYDGTYGYLLGNYDGSYQGRIIRVPGGFATNNTISTDRLFVKTNVGIGYPAGSGGHIHSKLHIHAVRDTRTTGGFANTPANFAWPITVNNISGAHRYNNGYGCGIKFKQYFADVDDQRWSAIAGVSEDQYSNGTGLVFFTCYNYVVSEAMRINRYGNVGIGCSPGFPLEVHGNTYYSVGNTGHINYNDITSSNATNDYITIKASNSIWAGQYVFASSDERIKKNIVDVPDNLALEMVRNIPVRYYEYKNTLKRGFKKTIGFIAQEVREIMPMAVSLQKNIIPNEMRNLSDISWNDTTLYTDLSDCSGIKYQFYVCNDVSGNDEIRKEVIGNSDNSFTFDTSYNNVFCYGKEVDDFHVLDKNKLYTINFSATQEIDRIQQQEITKVQSIQTDLSNANTTIQQQATKITTLETQIADILTRLSNLENTGSS